MCDLVLRIMYLICGGPNNSVDKLYNVYLKHMDLYDIIIKC